MPETKILLRNQALPMPRYFRGFGQTWSSPFCALSEFAEVPAVVGFAPFCSMYALQEMPAGEGQVKMGANDVIAEVPAAVGFAPCLHPYRGMMGQHGLLHCSMLAPPYKGAKHRGEQHGREGINHPPRADHHRQNACDHAIGGAR
jgi:hypothetical protein